MDNYEKLNISNPFMIKLKKILDLIMKKTAGEKLRDLRNAFGLSQA